MIHSSRSGSGNGSGRSRMPLTAEKIAVDAPMPSDSVTTTIAVKPGAFAHDRSAERRSWRSWSSVSIFLYRCVRRMSDSASRQYQESAARLPRRSACAEAGGPTTEDRRRNSSSRSPRIASLCRSKGNRCRSSHSASRGGVMSADPSAARRCRPRACGRRRALRAPRRRRRRSSHRAFAAVRRAPRCPARSSSG